MKPTVDRKMRGTQHGAVRSPSPPLSPKVAPPLERGDFATMTWSGAKVHVKGEREQDCRPAQQWWEMRRRGEPSETYQNCGKLSLSCSTDNQYSSSMSRSLSRRFLPNLWGVVLRVIAGRVDLCLVDRSETVTAFLTSVVEVFVDPWPDFLRWWCMRQV